MILDIKKLEKYKIPDNFIYDNENLEESLTDKLSENFIILIKFLPEIHYVPKSNDLPHCDLAEILRGESLLA